MADYQEIGKNHIRVDALEKVTGKATYAGDIYLPGMLMCKLLTSTHSHTRIVSIDTAAAEALPGVRCVITGKDYPDAWFGSGALMDRRIMARDEAFYIGEPLAEVAAGDEMTALEAIDLIELEYQDIKNVVDPLESISGRSAEVHPDMADVEGYGFALGGNNCTMLDADRGDVDQGFEDSDVIIEETYHTQPISQGFLEPMACVADVEANGRLDIYASTQGPYQVRSQLASVLDMPIGNIKVTAMEMGGGFGGKLRLALEAFPALLAIKTGRPVKLVNTREKAFTLNGPRLETNIYLKTGVSNDGHILAREARSIFDVGAYLGAGPNAGVGHGLGAYSIPNFKLRSYGVYTNKIYVGSYRASGVADMIFATESHTDVIAHKLGMDPMEFRMKNALSEGDTAVNGSTIPRNGLMETMEALKERMGLPKKLEEGRGVGIAVGEWRSGSGPSTASISVNEDGMVSLLTGSVDISGSDTSLAQIAAESLGLRLDQVVVAKRNTDMAPFTGPSGGSRIVYSQGRAVQNAAEDAKSKLLDLAQLAHMSLSSRGGPIIGTASLSSLPYAPVFNAQGAEVSSTGRPAGFGLPGSCRPRTSARPSIPWGLKATGGWGRSGDRPCLERRDTDRQGHR